VGGNIILLVIFFSILDISLETDDSFLVEFSENAV